MRSYGLLVLPLALALAYSMEYDYDHEELCEEGIHNAVLFEKDQDGEMIRHSHSDDDHHQNSTLSASLYDFTSFNISCIIYANQLNCWWRIHTHPENAQYYLSFDLDRTRVINCSRSANERVECWGPVMPEHVEHVYIFVHVLQPSHWYVVCSLYRKLNIEKLDPPRNISMSIKSKNLVIRWSPPKTSREVQNLCFMYELKINDEIIPLVEKLEYIKLNIDLTRSYSLQIKAKLHDLCATALYWSEWSSVEVIDAMESPYRLNVYIIVSIAFVLPMILLAFLLVCKFQRLSEKLFPSIPSPSLNITTLLEKNQYNQATHQQHPDCETEVFHMAS